MRRDFLNLSCITGDGGSRPLLLITSNVISVCPEKDGGCVIQCVGDFEYSVQESFSEIIKQLNLVQI